MNAITCRPATVDDAPGIGAVHVMSWRETYAGLLSQATLEAQSADDRARMWATALRTSNVASDISVFVADGPNGIVGFGGCSRQRDVMAKLGYAGEIGAIYVLRAHQGFGVRRSLMGLMATSLMARDLAGATLWVLRENAVARRFYERLG